MSTHVVVSCEHATNRVPARYRSLFRGAARALDSHRGWDPGALVLARELARLLEAPLIAGRATRLLVDPNRSSDRPGAFSEWSRSLTPAERERVLATYWEPHRGAVESAVHAARRVPVLHLSVHSFTPRWKGREREIDVGLLYDPARPRERDFVDAWLEHLAVREPELRLRRNLPYRGSADGLTTHLRTRFATERYLGIELEVSQRFPLGASRRWRELRTLLATSLGEVLRRR